MNTGIILLAAGNSSRMGASKQLLNINGETLLAKAANTALLAGADKTVIVLGAREKEHRAALHAIPAEVIVNSQWERGMGGSVKAGLRHLLDIFPDMEAVLIMVCDQPLLQHSHLQTLMQEAEQQQGTIIASFYQGTAGVPALFRKKHFDELLNLDESQGAKKIIQYYRDIVAMIDFPEGAIDLDTPKDVRDFTEQR